MSYISLAIIVSFSMPKSSIALIISMTIPSGPLALFHFIPDTDARISDCRIFGPSMFFRISGLPPLLSDRKLRKKFAGIRKKFGSIRNHLKGLTFSVILLGNHIISGEHAANINVLHSQDIRHSVRVT